MNKSNGDKPEFNAEHGVRSYVGDVDLIRKRRSQITAASIKIFTRLGFHKATVRDVALNANVSVGSIYQYYGDKEDLLYLALREIVTAYKEKIPVALESLEDPLERFLAATRTYCRVHASSSAATVLAYRETASLTEEHRDTIKQLEVETNELIAQCVRDCIDCGVFRDIDVDVFTYQIVLFSHAWALKSWNLKKMMSMEAYIEYGLDILLTGVLTKHGVKCFKNINLKNKQKNT